MLLELSLETLKEFDGGKIAVLFNQALQRVIDDVNNRPGDKTKRVVELKLTVKPICDAESNLESIEIKPHACTKMPAFHSRATQLSPRKRAGKNTVVFNPMSPDARQHDLGFEGAEADEQD